ncbi:stage II sporulation protein M [Pseudomonas sp. dw_358]|uniref:stage II sporulation protein M n=1 Tax=Pseudomonas sp. dw_358 TaxID=2720083 RepID=UPI001BD25430|nr:stage II sporulation protein M [Pseudomonas sp. dw_358]
MKQSQFEQLHRPRWQQFEHLLERLESRRASAEESEDFCRRYRHLCSQLALAGERGYSHHLIDTLQHLAMRGHQQLYRHHSRVLASVLAFVLVQFPGQVREQWRWVAGAALVFVLSLMLTLGLVYHFPDLIYAIISPREVLEMEAMYDPGATRFGPAAQRLSSTGLMMFGYYVMHNIGIAFQIFAGGLLLGLGSLYLLVSNGLSIGAVAGHLGQIGFNQTFWPFVIGHGAFELTGLVLAGAAGLRLGGALLAPGPLARSEALRHSARKAMQLVYGAVVLLLIAAFIEAYWSSITTLPASVKYAVGAGLWLLVLSYLSLAGRRRHAPE